LLLLDLRWLSSVFCSLHGCSEALVNQSLTAADRERADFLLQLLFQRLKNHKAARVMELPKRQSWVFDWVEENLAPVAAIALAFSHFKKKTCHGHGLGPLLSSREGLIVAAINELLAAEGCYHGLYPFDTTKTKIEKGCTCWLCY